MQSANLEMQTVLYAGKPREISLKIRIDLKRDYKQRVRQRRKMESEFRGKVSCIEYQLYIKSNSCACFVYQSLPFRTEYSNRLTVPVLFQKLLQMLLLSKVCLPWQSQVEYGSFEAFNIHPQASGSPPV